MPTMINCTVIDHEGSVVQLVDSDNGVSITTDLQQLRTFVRSSDTSLIVTRPYQSEEEARGAHSLLAEILHTGHTPTIH